MGWTNDYAITHVLIVKWFWRKDSTKLLDTKISKVYCDYVVIYPEYISGFEGKFNYQTAGNCFHYENDLIPVGWIVLWLY